MQNPVPDPQTLAQQTITEIETSLKNNMVGSIDILDALQDAYTTLEKKQSLYIAYTTDLLERIKTTPIKDEEDLEQLKKQVLQDVLSKEKTK